ncbi:fatty acid desaturase [Nocardia otitidiscaviarum]|uniref:Fatty acid desaturase n=1 Tax=Nocardia otitidiscaviarum TaxID=1823 RepID=A0A516NGM7_9NOCA|nr:fatty acid desaturase [Nocardia otitidiscaviarum]MCP9625435.1 fatty acid desaturase [Nocardia otitidiscaviarum]QDP78063.1 fatty acid desaturase [Nocardia otitidiscaviarum]
MAITNIQSYSHLTAVDIESFGRELDQIRTDIEDSLGQRDADYIQRVIRIHRGLETAARLLLCASRYRAPRIAGTVLLAAAKSIEMMELGHNIAHGQWDWMNDPEIHSTSWEWDFAGPSGQWQRSHNYVHHTYTNVYGMDEDLSFVVLRMTRDEPWRPVHLVQPISGLVVAAGFEWAIAVHDWALERRQPNVPRHNLRSQPNRDFARKFTRQISKDFLLFPALSGRGFRHTLAANASALLLRNLWSYLVIMCGHFPDGAEKFTIEQLERETRGEWYLRQLLGTANFTAGPVLAFLCGNLCYQIEHHLFPDLPSNRYPEIAERVRALCEKYDLPYTTGSLPAQFWLAYRTVWKLALPDRFLRSTSDDAAETRSERKFFGVSLTSSGQRVQPTIDPATGARRGLRTALAAADASIRRADRTFGRFRRRSTRSAVDQFGVTQRKGSR